MQRGKGTIVGIRGDILLNTSTHYCNGTAGAEKRSKIILIWLHCQDKPEINLSFDECGDVSEEERVVVASRVSWQDAPTVCRT